MNQSYGLAQQRLNDFPHDLNSAAPHRVDIPTQQLAELQLAQVAVQLGEQSFGAFNLSAQAGERIAILGASGAGKSTLLQLIAGGLRPQSGTVQWRNKSLTDWSQQALARQRAVLPQAQQVAFGLPVSLVVGLGRVSQLATPPDEAILWQAIQAAQAAHLWDRRFDTLSGGEQARVHLARVMAQLWDVDGGLLLVDEPLAALDPALQLHLLHRLLSYATARQHCCIAILHDVNHALQYFERLWLVKHGQLFADVPANLDALPLLEQLYDIKLEAAQTQRGQWVVSAYV